MNTTAWSRDELAAKYFEQLPFEPYPVQQEALLTWFTSDHGVLVCTPTGTGKTLIAEAAMFEALHQKQRAYYTTPLIALTEQKFRELQEAAVRWGFSADDVGLVTGNRRVNPDATVLVVVAEILFNRLLHTEAFDFSEVASVVMDEFHSFNDPERGIVWEFSLGLLPTQVRLMLLSATVGNAFEFAQWLGRTHQRKIELVQSQERRIPLTYRWIPDQLLDEQLETMAVGDDSARQTPALVFCFNREECWNVAELLKGKRLLGDGQQRRLSDALESDDWSQGAGPKLKQLLIRGVGVHHAGVLPRYRRVVERLFQRKLLTVCVCTETLAAGINLPARSVVIPNLLKGPPGNKKPIEASAAQQMFGRAGRPQFDTQGFVFALAHEDDVKILRWREKYDRIPEDTKDPQLLRAKKDLKRKMPTRRATEQYWNESLFSKLCTAPSAKLASRGHLPWRLLAYMLDASPDVDRLRQLLNKRLLDAKQLVAGQRELDRMLMILWSAGYVHLEPDPPRPGDVQATTPSPAAPVAQTALPARGLLDALRPPIAASGGTSPARETESPVEPPGYHPQRAVPTPELAKLLLLRGVNPLYGVFLVNQLGIADRTERLQAFESVLELPRSVAHLVRVPRMDELPPGPLAVTRLDPHLLSLGLATAEQLGHASEEPEEDVRRGGMFEEEKVWPLTLAEKLRLLFDYDFPGVHDLHTGPVWSAGELLEFGGNFFKYVTSKRLQKQEGIIFRHLLRLILLLKEFTQLCPVESTPEEWSNELLEVAELLTRACYDVDASCTDEILDLQGS